MKLRASVYFFILPILHSIWKGMYTAHYLQERKGRREERRDRGRKSERGKKKREVGRKGGGRQEINYYQLFQRMVQNRTCFHWATQSQLRWMPGSFVSPWPYFYSLHFRFFPFPVFVFFCWCFLWSSPECLTWLCHQLWSFPVWFPRSRRITK